MKRSVDQSIARKRFPPISHAAYIGNCRNKYRALHTTGHTILCPQTNFKKNSPSPPLINRSIIFRPSNTLRISCTQAFPNLSHLSWYGDAPPIQCNCNTCKSLSSFQSSSSCVWSVLINILNHVSSIAGGVCLLLTLHSITECKCTLLPNMSHGQLYNSPPEQTCNSVPRIRPSDIIPWIYLLLIRYFLSGKWSLLHSWLVISLLSRPILSQTQRSDSQLVLPN